MNTLSCSRPPHNHTNPGECCKKQIDDGAEDEDVEGAVVNLEQDKFQANDPVREGQHTPGEQTGDEQIPRTDSNRLCRFGGKIATVRAHYSGFYFTCNEST